MADTSLETYVIRTGLALYALLYEDAPFDESKLAPDKFGPFAEAVETVRQHHAARLAQTASGGVIYDVYDEARTIWEGLRSNDDGTKRYALIDDELKKLAWGFANERPPAQPQSATNGTKPKTEYVVDWQQQGISAAALQRKVFAALIWIVDGVLPEGATLLAGKPKSKKSWLALAVAVAVALCGKVLGYYDVVQGEVLYLDLESNQRRMKSRLNALIGAIAWPDNLHFFTEWPRGLEGIAMLDAWMLAHPQTKLIVIDILQNFRPPRDPKGNPYDQDYEAVKMINEFAERHRIAVIIIHHTRKAKADDVFDEISGTTGLSGGVSSMWVLGRSPDNSGESILALRGRDISDDDPMAVQWDNYTCQFVRVASGEEVSSGAARRSILNAMDEATEYQLKDLAAAVHKSVSATSNLIRRLMDDGFIQRVGNGRYARIPQQRESRESRERYESGVSSESQTFTSDHDVKVDVKVVYPLSEPPNEDFHDFHADSYTAADCSIDCADRGGRMVWRLWHDPSERIIGEYATEAEAQAAAYKGTGHGNNPA